MHRGQMYDKEFGSSKFLKLKYQSADKIIHLFYGIGYPQEIRCPLFKFNRFKKTERITTNSSKIHGDMMNNEEFVSSKFLKL